MRSESGEARAGDPGTPPAPMGDRRQLPIFQFWHSAEIPADVAGLIATVSTANPGLPHRVFDASQAERFIATHFTARELAAYRACALPAMQADYFRYCAVLAFGGIYVDADVECGACLESLLAPADAGRVLQRVKLPNGHPPPYPLIVNGLFAFRSPGHPLLRLSLEVATENIERRIVEDPWAVTGPGVFTSLYLFYRAGSSDAFVERASGKLTPTTAVICEVVGERARVSEAFEGVAVMPMTEAAAWVRHVSLPYKSSEAHWVNPKHSIFR